MKIAAFNVKKLGWRKVNKVLVRTNLIKIVSRYSVVVMLEVVDQSGKAMDKFLTELNNSRKNKRHPYAMKCSKSLGRSSYKEKFVFFYRQAEVSVIDTYQYKEGHKDVLAREPFILKLKCPNTVVQNLVLIPVHTKPEDTPRELDALHDVVKAVKKRWRTDNIMILGDFNADGHYLSEKKKKKIRICYRPYHWLIADDVDTTTSHSNDHTYDRIVVFGNDMYKAVEPGSAQTFNFQKAYRLSKAKTQDISDHYPVEVELKEEEEDDGEEDDEEEENEQPKDDYSAFYHPYYY
ncbi:deoxyribonuclease-1-like [Micropterus salmoides]|uniref:deoxyribonuclease-1-like n=1 Tax=Micropterus salmoides TaxID=27706 RepID=UPI0018ED4878|nr:deoxyribonuclease-1-like [Micropterus salmoides]XP_038552831.1 deoxyribonuclease-1-like [Micropterus salmoides]